MYRLSRITHPWIWLITLLYIMPSASFATTSPSTIMSRAMIAMMDTMGDLAHRFKGETDWDFDFNTSPSSSWYGRGGSPWGSPGWHYPHYPPSLLGDNPYTYSMPGFDGGPGYGSAPLSPYAASPATHKSVVDGIWVGRGGEIVLVMYGHFRIYASSKRYRDGRYRIVGNKLFMLDPETNLVQAYDYHLEEGKMVMRSESGTLLYFKQLPIPIPPYTLIHGVR
ncbi:MAG: hypothetical protein ABW098_20020 [Candidatus Thiodiazotropha sp.]